jgi:23S rRNA pseudouridine1911/1915/1917 synthase
MCPLPPTLEFAVERDLHGIRIDTFLTHHLRNYTKWRLARIVRAGGVRIDWAPVDENRRVARGERVEVRLFEPPDKLLLPQPIDLPLLFADAWILVVNKPAGLIAHPTGEYQTGTLVNALQHLLNRQTPYPGLLRPGVVHRLDRQTSGLMVVASQHRSHMLLSSAFEQGRVAKTYLALCEGRLERDEGSIDLPIGRTRFGRGVLMSARADAVDRKPACTRYRVVARYPAHTLVEARPLTGRNHQIRVHFAHIGHPLVGDEFYLPRGAVRSERSANRARLSGLGDEVGEIDDDEFDGRHMLHAARLEFAHPISDLWMTFSSPLPADFRDRIADVSRGAASDLDQADPGQAAAASRSSSAGIGSDRTIS